MAQQWQTLTLLCKKNKRLHEKVNELYRRSCFPYKIRSYFAVWIEANDWNSIDINTPDGLQKTEGLYRDLLTILDTTEEEMQASQSYDLEKTLDFTRAKHVIKKEFENNLGKFVDELKRCLEEERNLMDSCENEGELKRKTNQQPDYAAENSAIKQKLDELDQHISALERAVVVLEQEQDEFSSQYRKLTEQIFAIDQRLMSGQMQSSNDELLRGKKNLENTREQRAMDNLERRNATAKEHIDLATDLAKCLQTIWAEIRKWHAASKLAMVGLAQMKKGMLDAIDKMCQHGGQLLYQMIQQVETALNLFRKVNYPNDERKHQMEILLKELSDDYLPMFLQKAFIIEQSISDRILKVSSGRSTNFSISARILGGKALGLGFTKPKAKMSLFAERDIPTGDSKYVAGMCEIGNGDEKVFVIHHTNNACVAQFHSVQLKNIRRPDRGRNDELVTDQKFAFVFYTSIIICGRSIGLKTVSLPVILVSQTSQEIMARGTLVWDAAFSEENRVPFTCRETVPWIDVANVLSTLFYHTGGRPLAPDHLNYLAKMAFRENGDLEFNNMPINERQIIRERLPQREFSFWKWFWACLNLVKDRVQAEWRDGLIYGFISREDVKKKLWDQPRGTFLLRFSETGIENSQRSDVSGYLTLAVIEIDPTSKQRKLFHVREYLSPKEIREIGLPQILDAMEVADEDNRNIKRPLLRYLWPDSNRTFFEVFGPRIAQRMVGNDGYRKTKFAIEIILDDDTRYRHRHYDGNPDTASSTASPSLNPMSPQFSPLSYSESMDDCNIADDTSQDRLTQNIQLLYQRPVASVPPQANGGGQSQGYLLNGGPPHRCIPSFHNSVVLGASSGMDGTVGGSYNGVPGNELQHNSGASSWNENYMMNQLDLADLAIDTNSLLTTDSDGDLVVRQP